MNVIGFHEFSKIVHRHRCSGFRLRAKSFTFIVFGISLNSGYIFQIFPASCAHRDDDVSRLFAQIMYAREHQLENSREMWEVTSVAPSSQPDVLCRLPRGTNSQMSCRNVVLKSERDNFSIHIDRIDVEPISRKNMNFMKYI